MKYILPIFALLLLAGMASATESVTYDFELTLMGENDFAYIGNLWPAGSGQPVQPLVVGPGGENGAEFGYIPGGSGAFQALPQPTPCQLNRPYYCRMTLNFTDSRIDWVVDGDWKGAAPLRNDAGVLITNSSDVGWMEFSGNGQIRNLYIFQS